MVHVFLPTSGGKREGVGSNKRGERDTRLRESEGVPPKGGGLVVTQGGNFGERGSSRGWEEGA